MPSDTLLHNFSLDLPTLIYLSFQNSYIPGYAGFVPRSQGVVGAGFPVVAKAAIKEFDDDRERSAITQRLPIDLSKSKETWNNKTLEVRSIYDGQNGCIPRYSGHVPGGKIT